MRRVVFDAICAEAKFRGWKIYALNALDNHVHLLIAAPWNIDRKLLLAHIKSNATRALRNAGYFLDRPVWTSNGNVVRVDTSGYFWRVRDYINNKQKWKPFDLKDDDEG